MAEETIIETRELRKTYDGIEALRGLDLAVPRGSICGFLGRNGAGKTTTLKILLGMTHPTSGEARVFGLDAGSVEIRERCAFVSEEKDLYPSMTVEDTVRFTASFFPRWRRDLEQRYLRAFDLPPARKVKALSRGMRTKLALLLALCRGAELLILDEPTSGLDPAVAEDVLQALIRHVASEELTIFFSSHQIAEVDQISDRVVIIHRGRAVVEGALDDLREHYRRIELTFENAPPSIAFRSPGVTRVERDGRVVSVLSSAGADAIVDEARALGATSVDVMPVSLKELFLEVATAEGD